MLIVVFAFMWQIEGTFGLEQPPIILGYQHAHQVDESADGDGEISRTFLQLFISLEPPLSTLPPLTDKVSFEDLQGSIHFWTLLAL